jgi:hypothetical protein
VGCRLWLVLLLMPQALLLLAQEARAGGAWVRLLCWRPLFVVFAILLLPPRRSTPRE